MVERGRRSWRRGCRRGWRSRSGRRWSGPRRRGSRRRPRPAPGSGARRRTRARRAAARGGRACAAPAISPSSVSTAGWMPRASSRSSSMASWSSSRTRAEMLGAVVVEPVLEHFELEADGQQAVLGAVVEVALEAAAGLVGGGDDPRAARLELALALEPVGDVADVAGVHGRAGNVDAGDRELDRELAAVGVQRGDLDPLARAARRARARARRGGARAGAAGRAPRPARGRRAPPASWPKRSCTAALTSTIRPLASIVITASSAASSIARLRASLSCTAAWPAVATNCPTWRPRLASVASSASSGSCDGRGEELHHPARRARAGSRTRRAGPTSAASLAAREVRVDGDVLDPRRARRVARTRPGSPSPGASSSTRQAAAKRLQRRRPPSTSPTQCSAPAGDRQPEPAVAPAEALADRRRARCGNAASACRLEQRLGHRVFDAEQARGGERRGEHATRRTYRDPRETSRRERKLRLGSRAPSIIARATTPNASLPRLRVAARPTPSPATSAIAPISTVADDGVVRGLRAVGDVARAELAAASARPRRGRAASCAAARAPTSSICRWRAMSVWANSGCTAGAAANRFA